jgi:hypothetical protein
MQEKTWTLEVKPDPENPQEMILEFTDEIMAELGWQEGDTLDWQQRDDGSWHIENLSKAERDQKA